MLKSIIDDFNASPRAFGIAFDVMLVFFAVWFATEKLMSTQDIAIWAGVVIWLRWEYATARAPAPAAASPEN